MAWQRRVVWSEGMFLRPQHFQQQERYLEFYANSGVHALRSHAWGFEQLWLDEDALRLGKLALREARGLFPDGTPFSIPAQGDPPEPLDVPGDARGQRVLLALPVRRSGVAEVALGGDDAAGLTRFRIDERDVGDANTQGSPAALLQLGDLRLRLVLENDLTDGWMALGVARVTDRRPDNALLVDAAYMPPTLALAACPPLTAFLRELEGLLHHRGEAFAAKVDRPARAGLAQVMDFLLLELTNRWEPLVRHLSQQGVVHAETLYTLLITLAGDLSTWRDERRRPSEYPVYDHDDPQPCFQPVMAELRRLLTAGIDENVIAIELVDRGLGVRTAAMPAADVLRTWQFVLAVSAEVPPEIVRSEVPKTVKVATTDTIKHCVNFNLPGVGLQPLPVKPPELPFLAGFTYFGLDTSNELWRKLEQSRGLAVHTRADTLPNNQLKLWAIRA